YLSVTVKAPPVARLEFKLLSGPIPVGTGVLLSAVTLMANGDPRTDVPVTWSSLNSNIATIDESGFLTAASPGVATIEATAGKVKGTVKVEVIRNPVRTLAVEPKTAKARTGDVVRFHVVAKGDKDAPIATPAVRWAVTGEGATIEPDGAFVAEKPGSYAINA